MGYNVKKQAAVISKFERAEMDKEERAKLAEKQRNEGKKQNWKSRFWFCLYFKKTICTFLVFNQLKREFSSFSDETIRQVLKNAKYDTVDARSAMRQLESKAKLEGLLAKVIPASEPQREQNEAKEK